MLSGVRRQYAQFEFTGTGCDIYTRTSPTSGRMSLWLYNAEGRLLRLGMVDTSNTWLQGAEKDCYNTPVYSYRDLEYGSYKVEMRVETGAHGMEIALDGFRVYNTLSEDEGTPVYAMDSEAVPVTAEIRDITIANSTFGSENADLTDISAIYQLSGKIIKAVYDAANNGQGAVILENDGDSNSAITVDADMINNGPKNEIYLTGGQSIAMRFPNPKMIAKLAVGIRSLNGEAVVCKINGKEQPILSSVDMYYKVNANEDGMLVIQNDGDSVIALTKLKVTANPSTETPAVFSVFADADTIAYALMCMSDFVIEEPEVKPEKTDKEEQESEEPKREEPETEEPKRVEPFAEESVSQAVTEPVKKTAEEPASALTEESTAEERQPDAQPEEMQTEEAPVEELSEGNIPVQKDKKTKVSSYWLFGILGITVLAIGAFFIFKKRIRNNRVLPVGRNGLTGNREIRSSYLPVSSMWEKAKKTKNCKYLLRFCTKFRIIEV